MPAAKMTVAFLEARHGFQQDQDREEANSVFLDSSTGERKGCSLPWKEHRTYKTSCAVSMESPVQRTTAGSIATTRQDR